MKSAIIPIMLAAVSLGALAMSKMPTNATKRVSAPAANCTSVGVDAWTAMDRRQGGASFTSTYTERTDAAWQATVTEAWDTIVYLHIDNRISAMQDFRDNAIRNCLAKGGKL